MWWIIAAVIVLLCLFLWAIARSASNNVDEDTQRLLDEEQTRAIEDYLKKKKETSHQK